MKQGVSEASDRVPVRIFLPADPAQMRIGGIATFVRGFAKFAPSDFELSMVGVSVGLPPWTWQQIELEGRPLRFLPVLRHRGAGRGRIPLAARFVAALAWRGRDLGTGVVSSFHRPLTDLPIRQRGPMWRVVHLGVGDLTTSGSESRWAQLSGPLALSERRSFRRMDRIYVVNRRLEEQYRSRFDEVADRFAFVPNWVDRSVFTPLAAHARRDARAQLAERYGFGTTDSVLLYAGRLEGQKDPLLLARAFAATLRRRPNAHLLIAGAGGLEATVRAELDRQGAGHNATLLGTVGREAVARLMNASDALLITSAFETGPTVGLEALSCGLPVVTTDVGEVATVVERSGAGRVARSREAEAVAAAVEATLAAPAEALRSLAAAAAEPFAAERVLAPIYEENRNLAARLTG